MMGVDGTLWVELVGDTSRHCGWTLWVELRHFG